MIRPNYLVCIWKNLFSSIVFKVVGKDINLEDFVGKIFDLEGFVGKIFNLKDFVGKDFDLEDFVGKDFNLEDLPNLEDFVSNVEVWFLTSVHVLCFIKCDYYTYSKCHLLSSHCNYVIHDITPFVIDKHICLSNYFKAL